MVRTSLRDRHGAGAAAVTGGASAVDRLRRCQRSSVTNRRCADCTERGPTYVCLDFQTFVCQSCSGIHREFGHRIKSISLSEWTEPEVTVIEAGGNDRAAQIWLARWNNDSYPEPDSSDLSSVRDFIKLKYKEKSWYRNFACGQVEGVQPNIAKSAAASVTAEAKTEAVAEAFVARVEPKVTVSDLLSGDTPKGASNGTTLDIAVPVQSFNIAPGSPPDLGFGSAAAPGWSADFDSPGLTVSACNTSTACDGSGSNWGGSSGGLSTGDDLFDLDIGSLGNEPVAPMLPDVPPMPGATAAEAVIDEAPRTQPPQVAHERSPTQPEPAEEPPPVFEAMVPTVQHTSDVRPMPCAPLPAVAAKEKDRFAALDELLGAKPIMEFGDLLSVFHERNPIAGL